MPTTHHIKKYAGLCSAKRQLIPINPGPSFDHCGFEEFALQHTPRSTNRRGMTIHENDQPSPSETVIINFTPSGAFNFQDSWRNLLDPRWDL